MKRSAMCLNLPKVRGLGADLPTLKKNSRLSRSRHKTVKVKAQLLTYHVVKDGETLNDIATQYGVSLRELKAANTKTEAGAGTGRYEYTRKALVSPHKTEVASPGQKLLIPRSVEILQTVVVEPQAHELVSSLKKPTPFVNPQLLLLGAGLGITAVVGWLLKAGSTSVPNPMDERVKGGIPGKVVNLLSEAEVAIQEGQQRLSKQGHAATQIQAPLIAQQPPQDSSAALLAGPPAAAVAATILKSEAPPATTSPAASASALPVSPPPGVGSQSEAAAQLQALLQAAMRAGPQAGAVAAAVAPAAIAAIPRVPAAGTADAGTGQAEQAAEQSLPLLVGGVDLAATIGLPPAAAAAAVAAAAVAMDVAEKAAVGAVERTAFAVAVKAADSPKAIAEPPQVAGLIPEAAGQQPELAPAHAAEAPPGTGSDGRAEGGAVARSFAGAAGLTPSLETKTSEEMSQPGGAPGSAANVQTAGMEGTAEEDATPKSPRSWEVAVKNASADAMAALQSLDLSGQAAAKADTAVAALAALQAQPPPGKPESQAPPVEADAQDNGAAAAALSAHRDAAQLPAVEDPWTGHGVVAEHARQATHAKFAVAVKAGPSRQPELRPAPGVAGLIPSAVDHQAGEVADAGAGAAAAPDAAITISTAAALRRAVAEAMVALEAIHGLSGPAASQAAMAVAALQALEEQAVEAQAGSGVVATGTATAGAAAVPARPAVPTLTDPWTGDAAGPAKAAHTKFGVAVKAGATQPAELRSARGVAGYIPDDVHGSLVTEGVVEGTKVHTALGAHGTSGVNLGAASSLQTVDLQVAGTATGRCGTGTVDSAEWQASSTADSSDTGVSGAELGDAGSAAPLNGTGVVNGHSVDPFSDVWVRRKQDDDAGNAAAVAAAPAAAPAEEPPLTSDAAVPADPTPPSVPPELLSMMRDVAPLQNGRRPSKGVPSSQALSQDAASAVSSAVGKLARAGGLHHADGPMTPTAAPAAAAAAGAPAGQAQAGAPAGEQSGSKEQAGATGAVTTAKAAEAAAAAKAAFSVPPDPWTGLGTGGGPGGHTAAKRAAEQESVDMVEQKSEAAAAQQGSTDAVEELLQPAAAVAAAEEESLQMAAAEQEMVDEVEASWQAAAAEVAAEAAGGALPEAPTPGPAVPVAAAANADGRSVMTIKSELLELLYGTSRGLDANKVQRSRIEEEISLLEAHNLCAAPTKAVSQLHGRWKLIYTSHTQTLMLLNTMRSLPLVDLGDVYQVIDGHTLTVQNKIDLQSPFALSLTSELEMEARSPHAFKVRLLKVGLDTYVQTPSPLTDLHVPSHVFVLGQRVDLSSLQHLVQPVSKGLGSATSLVNSWLKPEVEVGEAQQGPVAQWMVTTFLDDTMRVERDSDGRLYVLLREQRQL